MERVEGVLAIVVWPYYVGVMGERAAVDGILKWPTL
jgi:hypothetical protein